MSGIESTRISTSITTYEKVKIQTVQQETEKRVEDFSGYNNDGYAKVEPNNKEGSASSNINILLEENSISNIKELSTGVLVGGSAGYLASAIGTGFMTGSFKGSSIGLGLGVAIGTGEALLNTESSNEKLNVAKNVAGSALLVGGATGVATSVAKSLFSFKGVPLSPSPTSVLLGATVGAGIKLANSDVDNSKLKVAKNAVAGTLIGGGTAGLVTAVGKTLLMSGSIPFEHGKGFLAKNLVSKSQLFSSPSRTAILVAATIGAGIAIANTKE